MSDVNDISNNNDDIPKVDEVEQQGDDNIKTDDFDKMNENDDDDDDDDDDSFGDDSNNKRKRDDDNDTPKTKKSHGRGQGGPNGGKRRRVQKTKEFWYNLCVKFRSAECDGMTLRSFLNSTKASGNEINGERTNCQTLSRYVKQYDAGTLQPFKKYTRKGPLDENSTTMKTIEQKLIDYIHLRQALFTNMILNSAAAASSNNNATTPKPARYSYKYNNIYNNHNKNSNNATGSNEIHYINWHVLVQKCHQWWDMLHNNNNSGPGKGKKNAYKNANNNNDAMMPNANYQLPYNTIINSVNSYNYNNYYRPNDPARPPFHPYPDTNSPTPQGAHLPYSALVRYNQNNSNLNSNSNNNKGEEKQGNSSSKVHDKYFKDFQKMVSSRYFLENILKRNNIQNVELLHAPKRGDDEDDVVVDDEDNDEDDGEDDDNDGEKGGQAKNSSNDNDDNKVGEHTLRKNQYEEEHAKIIIDDYLEPMLETMQVQIKNGILSTTNNLDHDKNDLAAMIIREVKSSAIVPFTSTMYHNLMYHHQYATTTPPPSMMQPHNHNNPSAPSAMNSNNNAPIQMNHRTPPSNRRNETHHYNHTPASMATVGFFPQDTTSGPTKDFKEIMDTIHQAEKLKEKISSSSGTALTKQQERKLKILEKTIDHCYKQLDRLNDVMPDSDDDNDDDGGNKEDQQEDDRDNNNNNKTDNNSQGANNDTTTEIGKSGNDNMATHDAAVKNIINEDAAVDNDNVNMNDTNEDNNDGDNGDGQKKNDTENINNNLEDVQNMETV